MRGIRTTGSEIEGPSAPVPCGDSRALRPWTPTRSFAPGPDPLFFASPKKRGEKKGDPTALASLGLRPREVPCAARSPAPARTRCARLRLAPLKQAGRVRREACLRHAGRSSVLLGGADGKGTAKQPIAGPRLADCMRVFVLAVGCLGPHSPSAPPSSARTRGSAPQARLVIWLRAACLSGASQRRAQRVLRDPRVLSSAGNPSRPQAGRGERSAGSPFFSPLFFGEAKKRGSGPGPKVLVGCRAKRLLGVQGRSSW